MKLELSAEEIKCPQFEGFIKAWKTEVSTGKSELVVDKKNLIMYSGADLLARALGGEANSGISHMYIGFNNTGSFTPIPITKASVASDFWSSLYTDPFGVLRLPLSFAPGYFNDTNYSNNIVLFSVVIASAESFHGAAFGASSSIYEAALVSAATPSDYRQDQLFSRVNFAPILYETGYNLTIVWGVRTLA